MALAAHAGPCAKLGAVHPWNPRLARRILPGLVALLLVGATACEPGTPQPARVVWRAGHCAPAPGEASHAAGALARAGEALWIVDVETPAPRPWLVQPAAVDPALDQPAARRSAVARLFAPQPPDPGPDSTCVRVLRRGADGTEVETARFTGWAPGLVALNGGGLVLAHFEAPPSAPAASRLVVRRGSPDGRTWEPAVVLPDGNGRRVAANVRLAQTSSGLLVLPETWQLEPDSAEVEIVCRRSRDGGRSWDAGTPLRLRDAGDPTVVERRGDALLLVLRRGTRLARCSSEDGGATWSAPVDLAFETHAAPALLARHAGRLALLWTDVPGAGLAPPALQPLRIAWSGDGGTTWDGGAALVQRPGRLVRRPGLATMARGAVLLFEERCRMNTSAQALWLEAAALQPGAATAPARARTALAPRAAREALRIWSAHTIERPRRAARLFVEGYFMRTLVAAHEALQPYASEDDAWLDTRLGIEAAIAYGDTMLARQNKFSQWPLGYAAVWYADMGAAVALFPALEPYVDDDRRQRLEYAAERFIRGLRGQGMMQENGIVGRGRLLTIKHGRSARLDADPYLVSSALVGIGVQGWLYQRTRRPEYRERALGALDYTLSQIADDGWVESFSRQEGSLRVAGYVEEGWMAADTYFPEPEVLERLRAALPRHVDWLLREQRPDGAWDGGADGEFARTPLIVRFLVWYDRRCESRPDVRAAIERAGASLVESARWAGTDLFAAGENQEVLRALAGPSLAALAAAGGPR